VEYTLNPMKCRMLVALLRGVRGDCAALILNVATTSCFTTIQLIQSRISAAKAIAFIEVSPVYL